MIVLSTSGLLILKIKPKCNPLSSLPAELMESFILYEQPLFLLYQLSALGSVREHPPPEPIIIFSV